MGYYFKPIDRISQIHPGSHVRHKISKEHSFVVTANYGDRATAVLTVDITNPSEWEVWVDENDQQP